jgi:tRNA(fMet)-specific endonuclease VapC
VNERYLLDTNILSDLVRNPSGRVAKSIARVGASAVATSVVVAAELRFGAVKKDSSKLATQVETILSALAILPLEPPVDEVYARLRAGLEATGKPIGSNDLLIASHALTLGLVVVTDNVREFSRAPGLAVENWLAP